MERSSREWSTHVDTLNRMMDPIDILTDQDLQNELSFYANTKFTFDTLPGIAIQDKPTILKEKYDQQQQQQHQPSSLNRHHSSNLTLSLSSHQHYHYQQQHEDNLSTPSTTLASSPSVEYSHYYMNHTPHSSLPTTPIATTPSSSSTLLSQQQLQLQPSTMDSISTKETVATNKTKRKPKSSSSQQQNNKDNEEEKNEIDIESMKLEKRRRNTAASARFRVKKKIREQALQKTACEMTEKANRLQIRVHELEKEVKWLKALLIEKTT